MIKTERISIGGVEFLRTCSDAYLIERDGVLYEEAIDPPEAERTYTEAAAALPELPHEEALRIIMEGAAG